MHIPTQQVNIENTTQPPANAPNSSDAMQKQDKEKETMK